ncbi:hypothetical protein AB6D66_24375 [Vibrio pomeroyi]|uniref:Uncharacterized protein n=1 Tax=Vibrio pomeroyi TaxID=198832 RepID=A0ABV4N4A3_9VIBR|nr:MULTISPECIES: hypothetical protein [unclassified Vibrio]UPR55770.1 hypothetical protein ITG10_11420 [Vibrio sp. ED004]
MMKRKPLKYDIKELMRNTDFEAQRNDPRLKLWQSKALYTTRHSVSESSDGQEAKRGNAR